MNSDGKGYSHIGRITSSIRHRRYLRSIYLLNNLYDGPEVVDTFFDEGSRILVISPHQDDEIIGCGGTLKILVDRGAQITVAYLTDGGSGSHEIPYQEQIDIREQEAKAGLEILGIGEMIFLRRPDYDLIHNKDTVKEVEDLIDEINPDIIFVPYFLDTHPDHAIAAKILGLALSSYSKDLNCYSYEVWTPLPPTIIVDISSVMNMKIQALQQHESQLHNLDYIEKIRGLNAYRSIYADGTTYCEAFMVHSRSEFIRMLDINSRKKLRI
ncbi:MAG: PIG-L family deacetylase [Euryarchaeota archaeon]|nr:PIG-L family deacetylase [Euryarchaeota archaeon]